MISEPRTVAIALTFETTSPHPDRFVATVAKEIALQFGGDAIMEAWSYNDDTPLGDVTNHGAMSVGEWPEMKDGMA